MPNCVVKGCQKHTDKNKKQHGITYHTFPTRDKDTRQKWIDILRLHRKDQSWLPGPRTVICSQHFDADDFYDTKYGLCRVQPNAYPKILPGVPAQSDYIEVPVIDYTSFSNAIHPVAFNMGLKQLSTACPTTQQPAVEFLDIENEIIAGKFPTTSNQDTESKSQNATLIFDPIKSEVCDEAEVGNRIGNESLSSAPNSLINKTIVNQDPTPVVKEEVSDDDNETYVCFEDDNSGENVVLNVSEINKQNRSNEAPLVEEPVVAIPPPVVYTPVNIVLTPQTEPDMYDKFMLTQAAQIRSLSRIDDRVSLLNSIERLVNSYVRIDNERKKSTTLNVATPNQYKNAMPSTSQIGNGKRKKM